MESFSPASFSNFMTFNISGTGLKHKSIFLVSRLKMILKYASWSSASFDASKIALPDFEMVPGSKPSRPV